MLLEFSEGCDIKRLVPGQQSSRHSFWLHDDLQVDLQVDIACLGLLSKRSVIARPRRVRTVCIGKTTTWMTKRRVSFTCDLVFPSVSLAVVMRSADFIIQRAFL
eukprot:4725878-Amphidinium_carterae.1